jgi:hypothetical protein
MQESKLKIDFTQGFLEVEGSEELVREIYNDFKESLKTRPQSKAVEGFASEKSNSADSGQLAPITTQKSQPSRSKTKSKKTSDNTGSFLKDLNLMGEGTTSSLKDFCAQYELKTNLERTLAFVYYLQHKLNITGININHIFTCYRDIGGKVPGHLKQNILDVSSKKGWLDTSSFEDIKVPVSGLNHLEHGLTKKHDKDSQ